MKLTKKRLFLLIRKSTAKMLLITLLFSQISLYAIVKPEKIISDDLTTASITLGNSRLSFRAALNGVVSSGSSTITITTGGGDNDTNALFQNDVVCFTNAANTGCQGHTTYTVASVVSSTVFTITPPLSTALLASDIPVSTQSGGMTILFTAPNAIPTDGDIFMLMPAVETAGRTSDGIPDINTAITNNGFDLTKTAAGTSPGVIAADVTVASSGCDNNWTPIIPVVGDGSSGESGYHQFRIDRNTNICTAGAILTITIDGTPGVINPAPITSGHTQGVADVYEFTIRTRDGSDNTIDSRDVKVAPIEAVLVSVTIDETINFTVAGLSSSTSTCNNATTVTTTATTIPFGTLTAPSVATGSQQLTVSTNADAGYVVKIDEDDQLSINGAGATTIADTICDDASCTHTTSAEWATGYNVAKGAFGYSLANVTGSDAAFLYSESSRWFSAKQLSERGTDFTPPAALTDTNWPTIMSNAGPVAANSIYVCFVVAFQATQEAGYYFNKVRYTATPKF